MGVCGMKAPAGTHNSVHHDLTSSREAILKVKLVKDI